MIIIKVGKNENIEKALKRYKNKVYKTKQSLKVRENKTYTKKSEVKRKEKSHAIYVQKIKDIEN
jgi:small subunit ribosomal protein S21